MKKIFKTVVAVFAITAITGAICVPAQAKELDNLNSEVYDVLPGTDVEVEGVSFDTDFGLSSSSISVGGSSAGTNQLMEGEDQYESNDDLPYATTGLSNQIVYANLHSESDQDWYQFTITQEDINNDEYYSIILTNIPNNCTYYAAFVDSYRQGMYIPAKEGYSNSKEIVFSASQVPQGNYYVLVGTTSGYSLSNYKLYFGKTYKNKSYGWTSTGLTYHFPNKQSGTSGYEFSTTGSQILNLMNNSTIPNYSIVKRFYLDADGTGTWGGFYKVMRAYDLNNEMQTYTQYGGVDLFGDINDDTLIVKQQWLIDGYINYASGFVWRPNVYILYKWPVLVDTLNWL